MCGKKNYNKWFFLFLSLGVKQQKKSLNTLLYLGPFIIFRHGGNLEIAQILLEN